MAQRFELEVVTAFKTEGIEAAVAKLNQGLRQVSAPTISGTSGGSAPKASGGGADRQITEFNQARLRLEQLISQAQSAGNITDAQARAARASITNEINGLLKTNQEFVAAVRAAEQKGIELLRTTSQAQAQLKTEPLAPLRPQRGGVREVGEGAGSSERVARTNQAAKDLGEENKDGKLAQASAQLAAERQELAAQIERIKAADSNYISSTTRLTQARTELAASVASERRNDPSSAIDRNYQQRLFNSQVSGRATSRIANNPSDTAIIGEQRLAQTRLSAAVSEQSASDENQNLAKATAQLRAARLRLAEQANSILAGDKEYADATVRLAAQRNRVAAATASGTRVDDAALSASIEAALERRLLSASRDAGVNERILASDQAQAVLAQKKLQADQTSLAIKDRANRIAVANNGGQVEGGGTLFQRAQASLSARQDGGTVDPNRFQTGGQFLASRAFTTAGFALSGAALYGGVEALQSMVEQTEKLDEQFALLKQQFEAVGDGDEFKGFRNDILAIARDTGVVASDVATVAFQLKGSFKDTQVAIDNTRSAMELVRTTGLSIESVTNNLTAVSIAYGKSFEEVGDKVTALEQRYGVLATQSFEAFGVVAAAAEQAGLTFDQVGEIIGVVGRASGRGADAIGESLNRILPSIQGNATQIQQIYRDALAGGQIKQEDLDSLTTNLATGETGKALYKIIEDNKKFTEVQRNQIITALGGQREAQTVIPILQGTDDIQNGVSQNDEGALQRRFDVLAGTIQQKLKQIGEEFRQLGVQLGNAGVLDAMKILAETFLVLVQALGGGLRIFNEINEATGGVPGKLLAIVIAAKLLQLTFKGLKDLGNPLNVIFKGSKQTGLEAGINEAISVANNRAASTSGVASASSAIGNRGRTVDTAAQVDLSRSTENIRKSSLNYSERISRSLTTGAETISTNVRTGVTNFANRIRRLGDSVQANQLPGPTASQRGGVGGFITGGQGGLAGGLVTASAAAGAATSLFALAEVIQDLRKKSDEASKSIDSNLNEKSFQNIDSLQKSGVLKDSFATRLGSLEDAPLLPDALKKRFRLNKSIEESTNEALGGANLREFNIAIENNLFKGNEEEIEKLREEVEKSKGLGKAGEKARAEINKLTGEDKIAFDKLIAEANSTTATAQSGGDSNIEEIQNLGIEFESGNINYGEYINGLAENVNAVAALARGGDIKATENLRKAIVARNQAVIQANQASQQLSAQLQQSTGATAADIFQQNSRRVTFDAPAIEGSVKTPGFASVNAPQQYDTKELKEFRLKQLTDLVASGQAAFNEALQRGAGPDEIQALQGAFSLTAPQIAELQNLQFQLYGEITNTGELLAGVAQLKQARDNAFQIASANVQAQIAGLSDPVAINNLNAGLAQKNLGNAREGGNPIEIAQAEAGIAQQARTNRDTQDQIAQSRQQLQAAMVADNPISAANSQIAAGQLALGQARGNEAAMNQARAQIVQGQQAVRQAQQAVAEARINLVKAQNPNDALRQAQADQQLADVAARNAVGDAAKLTALAQRVAADKAVEAALDAISDSRLDILTAQSSTIGDVVRISQIGLERANEALSRARSRGAGEAELNGLKAQVIDAQNSLAQTTIDDQQSLIDFQLEMGQITKDQAIAQLQALLANQQNVQKQRELQLKIKQLQDQATGGSAGLQFNLPTTLGLPTLYTARRLAQEAGRGDRAYTSAPNAVTNNDNRVVTIQLNAANDFDGQAAVQTIVSALNDAPRYGTQPRLY